MFSISQSTSPSKKIGQDCMSATIRGDMEVCVLCDGHDEHGGERRGIVLSFPIVQE